MKIHLIFFTLIFSFNCFSKEVGYLARSPQALLMGDAFTAVADDEYTLFYNPAVMGRNDGVSFVPFSPSFGFNDPLTGISKFSNFPSGVTGITDRLMNYPVYTNLSIFPTIKMARFGLSLFLNNEFSMVMRNSINPLLDIHYKYDRGFVAGFAYNLGNGSLLDKKSSKSKKKKSTSGERLSIGFSVKHINREGIDNRFNLVSTSIMSSINGGSISSIKSALGASKGDAWGYDIGAEYGHTEGSSTFTAGISILDIGDTRFTKTEGTFDVPKQRMYTNAGVAYKQDFGVFDYTLSADLHPFMGPVDFSRQLHLGARVGVPFVTAFGGFSEGYLSYGAQFDIWPFTITTGWYGVETGAKYRQQESKRFLLYLSLFDFSIDL